MEIRMLKDAMATTDGHHLAKFCKDETYDVRETVGCRLIQRGEAVNAQETNNIPPIWKLAQITINARNAEIERSAQAGVL